MKKQIVITLTQDDTKKWNSKIQGVVGNKKTSKKEDFGYEQITYCLTSIAREIPTIEKWMEQIA